MSIIKNIIRKVIFKTPSPQKGRVGVGLLFLLPALSWAGNIKVTVNAPADSVSVMVVNFLDPMNLGKEECAMSNGTFTYETAADEVRMIVITLKVNDGKRLPMARVHAIPDCPMTVDVTADGVTIGGTPEYESISKARKAVGDENLKISDEEGHAARVIAYIKENPADIGAAYIASDLGKRMLEADSLIAKEAKEKLHGYYDYFLNKVMAPIIAKRNAEKSAAGNMAHDFTLKDLDGNDFTLSSLRGKYVILDFWGSWCMWCIKGMPKLAEFYQKHKAQGLEVVSIACSDTDAKWRAAVAKNNMNWINVFNGKDDADNMSLQYGITAFPTKIVISPEGEILKVTVGEDDSFYTFLEEKF